MLQDVNFTANLGTTPVRQRLPHFTRGQLLGFAGALVAMSVYFGAVVWIGNDLAADMKAGTREVTAGMMVPDLGG